MDNLQASLLSQLDAVLDLYHTKVMAQASHSKAQMGALSGEFCSSAMAAIERAAGGQSGYYREAERYAEQNATVSTAMVPELALVHVHKLVGVVNAVRDAVASGYLVTAREMIHGEVFGDFLEQSAYLLDHGYKDPAAVIGGGVLESHMRNLCERHGIDITESIGSDTRPKKAETMNADLAKAGAYDKLQQKNITAWLDLRNKAAHGEYGKYVDQEVRLMLAGIRDFVTRFPA